MKDAKEVLEVACMTQMGVAAHALGVERIRDLGRALVNIESAFWRGWFESQGQEGERLREEFYALIRRVGGK